MDPNRLIAVLAVLVMTLPACARHHAGGYGERDMDAATERGVQDMAAIIDKTVKDPQRAAHVKELAKEIVNEAKQSYVQHREFHRQLYDLNANYDATPEAFMKILDESNNHAMRSGSKILGLRFKIKEQLSREEWKALTDEMKRYADRYRSEYGER